MENVKRRNFLSHLGAFAGGAFVVPGLMAAKNANISEPFTETMPGYGNEMPGASDTYSVVISLMDGRVSAVSRGGGVIANGAAGKDDADVFQKAIDSLGKEGGEIRVTRGRFRFSRSVTVDLPVTITGEGHATQLVPPTDDYLFKIMTTERSPQRPNSDVAGDDTLSGVAIMMLTIDGERAGKGIYVYRLFDSIFQNLWMHDIHRGSAIHLEWWVCECNFVNIHLNSTGCKETGAASIHMNKGNNLHFNRIYTIFPEARGLQVNGGTIVYFNDCMWHGHFPHETATGKRLMPRDWPENFSPPAIRMNTEELIYVEEIGYDKGLYICRSRITNNHPDYSHMVVKKGEVSVIDGIIGGGGGASMIRAQTQARMRISGNHFEGFGEFTPDVLQCHGAEIIFRDNVVEGPNKQVTLLAAQRSVITGNRFVNTTRGASLRLLDDNQSGCRSIVVRDNMFQETQAGAAIEIGKLSKEGVILRDNFYEGSYPGDPVIQRS